MAGQLWSVSSLGGAYYALNLSKELRIGVSAMTKFRQFADVKNAFGKTQKRGDTFTWDTVPMVTRGNRRLTETNTIPQGNHTIIQGTLTMDEHGFSVPYTGKLDALSQFSVREPIMRVLRSDAAFHLDAVVWEQFNKTPLRVAATATGDSVTLTTNSTATLTNSAGISTTNLKSIVDTMRTRNIPAYEHGDYYAIARPNSLRGFKDQIEALHIYTETGLGMIMQGEIGRYERTRIVEQTNIPAGGAADSTTFDPFTDTADPWNVTSATQRGDWMFFFGEDTVCEAVHTMEEIRAKMPDDYDRSQGIAWYGLMGYAITHTNVTQARIFKWDSAV